MYILLEINIKISEFPLIHTGFTLRELGPFLPNTLSIKIGVVISALAYNAKTVRL